jgi:hypothetical protein
MDQPPRLFGGEFTCRMSLPNLVHDTPVLVCLEGVGEQSALRFPGYRLHLTRQDTALRRGLPVGVRVDGVGLLDRPIQFNESPDP